MIRYKTASSADELEQILLLQRENLPEAISEEVRIKQGFVTVHHGFDLLKRMNDVCPHIIAKKDDKVVGYALCMHPNFGDEIDVLLPMFSEIKKIVDPHKKYIVMGQVCIDKLFRKRGLFRRLYETMLHEIQPNFTSIITEVDIKNSRSQQAHYAIGFQLLSRYQSGGHNWELIELA